MAFHLREADKAEEGKIPYATHQSARPYRDFGPEPIGVAGLGNSPAFGRPPGIEVSVEDVASELPATTTSLRYAIRPPFCGEPRAHDEKQSYRVESRDSHHGDISTRLSALSLDPTVPAFQPQTRPPGLSVPTLPRQNRSYTTSDTPSYLRTRQWLEAGLSEAHPADHYSDPHISHARIRSLDYGGAGHRGERSSLPPGFQGSGHLQREADNPQRSISRLAPPTILYNDREDRSSHLHPATFNRRRSLPTHGRPWSRDAPPHQRTFGDDVSALPMAVTTALRVLDDPIREDDELTMSSSRTPGRDAADRSDLQILARMFVGAGGSEAPSAGEASTRGVPAESSETRSGDWACPKPGCGYNNFNSKDSCRQCGSARPGLYTIEYNPPANPLPLGSEGDWKCTECGFINWRRRKLCKHCYPNLPENQDHAKGTMPAGVPARAGVAPHRPGLGGLGQTGDREMKTIWNSAPVKMLGGTGDGSLSSGSNVEPGSSATWSSLRAIHRAFPQEWGDEV